MRPWTRNGIARPLSEAADRITDDESESEARGSIAI